MKEHSAVLTGSDAEAEGSTSIHPSAVLERVTARGMPESSNTFYLRAFQASMVSEHWIPFEIGVLGMTGAVGLSFSTDFLS